MMRPRPRPWIAAARLGLGLRLANVRSCSSVGAGSEKNVYLVFDELKWRTLSEERRRELNHQSISSKNPVERHRSLLELETLDATHVVRRILLNTDDDEDEVVLPVEAYKKSEICDGYSTNCTTLGSKIVIPLFSQVSSRTGFEMRSFSTTKYNLQLGEIDGKLYCIDFGRFGLSRTRFGSIHHINHFEVFDPNSPLLWRVLGFPVRFQNDHIHSKHTAFLPEIKKILISKIGGSYCFDVTKPKAGWKCLYATPERNILGRFKADCPPLFIHNYHPAIGDHYAVFDLRSGSNPRRSS